MISWYKAVTVGKERRDPRDVIEAENLGLAYHLLLYFPRL